jgi:hypothetical protein
MGDGGWKLFQKSDKPLILNKNIFQKLMFFPRMPLLSLLPVTVRWSEAGQAAPSQDPQSLKKQDWRPLGRGRQFGWLERPEQVYRPLEAPEPLPPELQRLKYFRTGRLRRPAATPPTLTFLILDVLPESLSNI